MRGRYEARRKGGYTAGRIAAILLCLSAAAVFGMLGLRQTKAASDEREANIQLARQVEQRRQENGSVPQAGGMLPQYAALWEQNHDLAGWLRIPDTEIDYPVMFTPDKPGYYLRRAFDGSDAVSGSLFIGEDGPPSENHAVIYGHHMKNGTMFGLLTEYANADHGMAHPVLYFDTLEEAREYEVMAAFYSRLYTDQDEGVFRYYQYGDLSDPETFEAYVRQVQAAALYDTGVRAEYGDYLLTLSTCGGRTKDQRFVVVARCRQTAP